MLTFLLISLVVWLVVSRHSWKQRALRFQLMWLEEALGRREDQQAALQALQEIQEELSEPQRVVEFEVPWPESDPRLN